jgi:hypothetical protein
MTASFKIDIKVETPDKETIPETQTIDVEAHGTVEVTIPEQTSASKPVKVDVQPSATGQVKFLLIKADQYDGKLKYSVGETASNEWITVNALQVLPENGLLPLFPDDPKVLWFQNTADEKRTVLILVGRMAVVASSTDTGGASESGQSEAVG